MPDIHCYHPENDVFEDRVLASFAQGFLFSYEKLFGVKKLSSADLSNIENNRDSSMKRTKRLFYVVCRRAKESLALITYTKDVEKLKEIAIANGYFFRKRFIINICYESRI